MKALAYIYIALLALGCLGCSKTTTEFVYIHDTLTVERAVVQTVTLHDTVTVKADTERDEVRVVYDTLERVREVVRTQWRDKTVTEQGAAQTVTVHDTVTVQAATTTESSTDTGTGISVWWYVLVGIVLLVQVGVVWVLSKDKTG